jgi:hypothetical protein
MTINDKNVSTRLTETENQAKDEMQKQSGLVIQVRDRLKEKTMFRAPFILEDAIGTISPVQWTSSILGIPSTPYFDYDSKMCRVSRRYKTRSMCFKNTQPRERSSIRTRGIACFWQGNESI